MMNFKTITIILAVALSSCNSMPGGKVTVANAADSEAIPVHITGKDRGDRRVTQYKVITGKSMGEGNAQVAINAVQDQMKDAMGIGWQPQGGLSISVDKDYRYTCVQAIVLLK